MRIPQLHCHSTSFPDGGIEGERQSSSIAPLIPSHSPSRPPQSPVGGNPRSPVGSWSVIVFVTLKRQLHDKVSAPSQQLHACARPCRQNSCMASRPAAGMQKPQLQGCRMTAAIGESTRCPQKVHPGRVAASAKLVFERSILKPVWQAAFDRYTFPDVSLLSATAFLP